MGLSIELSYDERMSIQAQTKIPLTPAALPDQLSIYKIGTFSNSRRCHPYSVLLTRVRVSVMDTRQYLHSSIGSVATEETRRRPVGWLGSMAPAIWPRVRSGRMHVSLSRRPWPWCLRLRSTAPCRLPLGPPRHVDPSLLLNEV